METEVLGIYHSIDLDGFSSGAIIKKRYPTAVLMGWNYGDPIPIPENKKIIMSDISFPMSVMWEIGKKNELLWIDHHISAIKDFEKYQEVHGEPPFKSVLNNKFAACELTWETLFTDDWFPESIRMLGKYDSWRNDDQKYWENYILPYQYGMRSICNSVDSFPGYALISNNHCNDLIQTGKVILKYQTQQNEALCKKAAFKIVFKGYDCICLNGSGFSSNTFDSVYDESKHDFMMPFQFDGKVWHYSLYSTKVDVDSSVVAKEMGGGGHKGAAGFTTNVLIPEIVNAGLYK
jgi:oligoribonuclease NrnB/cAMP/cGMP phosphodiesterase (DHH superfamily)